MKRPAFQFYPADWRKDVDLQSCSVTARGIWHELLCVMHECKPYGHLVLQSGAAPTDAQAARLVGATAKEYKAAIIELEAVNVFSRLDDGTIYSRRMVKDERLRNVRADNGQKGAEHGIKGAEHGKKGGRPPVDKSASAPLNNPPTDPPKETGLEPPPSSSSSSSSSYGVQRTNEDARPADPENPSGNMPLKGNGKSKPPPGWHRSPEGIDKAGRMLGMQAKRGEDYEAYKARIFDALREDQAA